MSRLSLLIACHLALWIQFTSSFTIHQLPISSQRAVVSQLQSSHQDTIIYEEPVFRPPAEWRSLILQVTIGCSWNKCTFCEMYQTKTFRSKPIEDVELELKALSKEGGRVRDIFLADGDAMALPTKHLLQVCKLIKSYFPEVRRISSYCLPRNLRFKTVEDLTLLREAGLSLVYVGCESGNDEVLKAVEKGETFESSLDALTKLRKAGIKRSVMILLGLGGSRLSRQHAISSAELCSAGSPEFLSVLTTSFPKGMSRVEAGYSDQFQPLTPREGLQELKDFLEHLEITTDKTIFRSDHASNYLILKGRLGRDKAKLLDELNAVLEAPEEDDVYNLRPEWLRGL
jgi:radical SAM superfamily enzyme YgiQ (UPF0313 family)